MALNNSITLAATGSTGTGRKAAAGFEGVNRLMIEVVVEAVGATPTMTFTIQGSTDNGATFADIAYVDPDATVASAKTAKTVTTVGRTVLFVDGLDKRFWDQIAVNVSANTNVTFRATAYLHD